MSAAGIKIWYLLPTMNVGGAEKHVIQLARELHRRGFETGIATVFEEGILAPEVQREGIPFNCLHIPKGWGAAAGPSQRERVRSGRGAAAGPSQRERVRSGWGVRTAFRLGEWIRSVGTDILHTYLFGFHLFAGLPARFVGVPVVISSRREIADWRKWRHRFVENLGNFFVDRVVCCSDAVRQWTHSHERIGRDRTLTIYNGVDLDRFGGSDDGHRIRAEFGIPSGVPLIGTVANFAVEKGYPTLVGALGRLLKNREDAWFLIVGAGPLEGEIRGHLSRVPGGKRVVFAGLRSDIPELISAMDIFVLASLAEGFPNVLLEAMALSKPVVATRVGGVPELIHSEQDGILVPPRDGWALAEGILTLLADARLAQRMGVRAGERIRQFFSLKRMADQYEAFYLSLVEQKRREGARAARTSSPVPEAVSLEANP